MAAQTFSLPEPVVVPLQGAAPAAGDNETFTPSGEPQFRPVSPLLNLYSASLEYITWNSENKHGFNRIAGNQITSLNRYTRGLPDDMELGVLLPLERVQLNGFGHNAGLGDLEISGRKYFYDHKRSDGLTTIATLRASLPTGDAEKGLGLGKASIGPSLAFSQTMGGSTLLYAGGGITLTRGNSVGVSLKNAPYAWAGGIARISPRVMLQIEGAWYKTPFGEEYTSVLVGPRVALSPTRSVQISVRKELRAAGKPTTILLGYSFLH